MSKPYKIKRNTRMYRGRGRRPSPLSIVLTVVGCCVLAFLGWSLYQPVYNLVTGNISSSLPTESSSTPSAPVTSDSESESQEPVPEETSAQHLVYLPHAIMADATQLDAFLQSAVDMGANGVMMDLKDANGYLLYQSTVAEAVGAGAISSSAVDLPTVLAALESYNMTPVARIHTWVDPIAPRTYTDMAVKYNGTETLWLTDTRENGGQNWMNPYSESAQKYITDISLELAGMGIKEIVLDGYYFPTMVGSEYATYGETADTVTRDACLKNYLATLTAALEPSGTEVGLYVTGASLFATDQTAYGGVNPATLGAENLLVNAMPASFGSTLTIGEETLASPAQSPYQALTMAATQIKTIVPEGTDLTMFVQCYTADGLSEDQNKTYTREDISEQLRALTEQEIEDYLLFSPTGTFPAE